MSEPFLSWLAGQPTENQYVLPSVSTLPPPEHRDPVPPMWRDRARAAQAPPSGEAVRYTPEELRTALGATNWSDPAIAWAIQNVPAYRTPPREDSGGRYYGGFAPDVGRVEVNSNFDPTTDREQLNHEMHHAADYAYRTSSTPWPAFQYDDPASILADLQALARRRDYPIGSAMAQQVVYENPDAIHLNHRLDDRLGHHFENVPPEYAAKRFPFGRYSAPPGPPTPTRYRYVLPVVGR